MGGCHVIDPADGPLTIDGDACDNTCAPNGLDQDGNECDMEVPEETEDPILEAAEAFEEAPATEYAQTKSTGGYLYCVFDDDWG